MTRARGIQVSLGAAVSVLMALSPGAISQAEDIVDAEAINAEIVRYQEENPDDLIGLDSLVKKYTGKSLEVSFPDVSEPMGAADAQNRILRDRALDDPGVASSDKPQASGAGLSTDTFRVWIVKTPLVGPPAQYRYNGRWDFKDSFAGQGKPYDEASLSFDMPSCMHMVNHSISTYSVEGESTGLGSLRSANTSKKAPIWNVKDGTSEFQNMADHGAAGVTIQNYCTESKEVAADFAYEFNQGGSIVEVSAGWGVLEVSYGSPTNLQLQKGTSPIYETF